MSGSKRPETETAIDGWIFVLAERHASNSGCLASAHQAPARGPGAACILARADPAGCAGGADPAIDFILNAIPRCLQRLG